MKFKLACIVYLMILPFKVNSQTNTSNHDAIVAKQISTCAAIYKILTNIGHASKKENLVDDSLSEEDKNYLLQNSKKNWELLQDFLKYWLTFEKAYASIHEYYKTTDYKESIGLDSNSFESKAKQDSLNANVSTEWIEKSIQCLYFYEELNSINITKSNVIDSYKIALNKYDIDMRDKNNKDELHNIFRIISRHSLIAWKNYRQFETLHESNMKVKRIIDNNRHKLGK